MLGERAASDCFLGPHPEHVNARGNEPHAKLRVKVVEFNTKPRLLPTIFDTVALESQSS